MNDVHSPPSWVVMGVSGSGKTEIARRLAARLQSECIEGDEFHPAENIAKMSAGVALDDEDRRVWLLLLQGKLREAADAGQPVVLACSALKRRYRDVLRAGNPDLIFLFLDGDRALLASRMQQRRGHFMPTAMLDGQLAALEPPQADERFLRLDIRQTPDEIVERVVAFCAALPAGE